ncbi:MAG TPA: hypothetical protein VH701_07705 [Vicinamibacterales bacterium]
MMLKNQMLAVTAAFIVSTVTLAGQVQKPAAPAGQQSLGTVRISQRVTADGKPLAAGTYQLRLTPDTAKPENVIGQTPTFERWVEFVQGGQVRGREVVSIVPASEIATVAEDTPPGPNGQKVQLLKGNDYVRIWIRRGDQHYLIHLPVTS